LFIIVLFIIIASSTRAFWVTFFIFVILPAVALYVYSLYRKNVKQKGEDIKLANEMEAKKDTIIAFKKSEDYQLLTKYVQIYPNSDYKRDRNYHLQTLRQVITSRWTISEEEITNFLNVEGQLHLQQIFNQAVQMEIPSSYDDYLQATLTVYGDNACGEISKLYCLLISKEVINANTPLERLEKDLKKKEIESKTSQLRKSLFLEERRFHLVDADTMSPLAFESFVAKLFQDKGYHALVTKASGDQGADVILERLGEKVVIQVKQYSSPVTNKAVQEVVAAKIHYGANRAIVVTNNYFTASAQELARSNNVQLIDRKGLEIMLL